MRILFLSTWFPYPIDNGSKIRVNHLLRALSQRHEVSLLSFAFDTADPTQADELRHFCSEVQVIPQNPFQRGALSRWLRPISASPIVTWPTPEMALATRTILARQQFDLVIASVEVTAVYALMAPSTTYKVLEEHNSLSRWTWERYQDQVSPLQRLWRWFSWRKTTRFEAQLFRKFDLCTMVSEQDRVASVRLLADRAGRVEVVPNGVDCEYYRPEAYSPCPDTLIYNGALTYSANYDAMCYFLAEIYPRLKQQAPGLSLTITGAVQGVDRSGLQLDDSVHWSGQVPDIRPLVGGSAVCVVPIRQGGGTRLKILEAMALGVPVVATRKGAEGLDVVDGQHLLLADDAAEFTAKTLAVLQDMALRERLTVQARQLVEQRYDWKMIGQHFVELLEAAAHDSQRHV